MAPRTTPRLIALSLAAALLGAPGCAQSAPSHDHSAPTAAVAQATQAAQAAPDQGKNSQAGEVAPRKIIRNAELTIEARDAAASRDRAIRLVEQAGGYVASSTESHGSNDDWVSVSVTLKVPAERLSQVLTELRGLGTQTSHEHVGSQDVTAEFYDLSARLKAQRAVEAQLLEIAKEAKTVPDLLAVQRQLGEVRGEIERMEGRRNQIDSLVSLSTVQLTIQREHDIASASLAGTFKKAGGDAVAVGSSLVHGSIRMVGVLVPLAVFFGPLLYVAFRLLRRLQRRLSQA